MLSNILFVGLGGAFGAMSRYVIVLLFAKHYGTNFPYGTLFVNAFGSFLLLFLLTIALNKLDASSAVKLFIAVGFMGSFTTFSSFTFETLTLFTEGLYVKAIANVLLNNFLAISGGILGLFVGRSFL